MSSFDWSDTDAPQYFEAKKMKQPAETLGSLKTDKDTCCDYGTCTQGRNCPVRKQRIEATNQAYIERGRVADTDPYTDTLGTVKALIATIVVCVAVTLLSYLIWSK